MNKDNDGKKLIYQTTTWRSLRSLRLGESFLNPLFMIVIVMLLLASCGALPSPLYGTWADNRGNTFSFFDDNTFNARIEGSAGMPDQNYSGNYSVLMNTLTLDCTNVDLRVVTEWDIRGNIMYLNWVSAESGSMSLTMFKISN